MNISGVTATAQTMPSQVNNQMYEQVQAMEQGSIPASNAINTSLMASVQVMDLAQSAFEDAAARLIDTMSAMTGVGQNFDISV